MVFDMWEEMRVAVMMARARAGRADALTATQVLRMATLGGAEAIGLADEIGSLTPGKAADVTVLDLGGTPFLPWDDPSPPRFSAAAPIESCSHLWRGRYAIGTRHRCRSPEKPLPYG